MTRIVLVWTPSGSCPLFLTPPCYQLQKAAGNGGSFFGVTSPRWKPYLTLRLDSRRRARNDLFIISPRVCNAGSVKQSREALTMSDRSQCETALVQFSERLTNSAAFGSLFREGMDLVEETAAYLDGAGRTEAKALERSVSLTYATESMRLTTRLMQLASWLLLHRAVKEGEMTLIQANREKTKVKLSAADPGPDDMIEKLPP